MARSLWVVFFILAFLLGVLLRSLYDFGGAFTLLLLLLGGALLALSYIHSLSTRGDDFAREVFLYCALCLFALSLGSMRTNQHIASIAESAPRAYYEERVEIEGVVVREPDVRENSQHLVVASDELGSISGDTLLRVTLPAYIAISYGERLRLSGEIERAEAFETDTGRIFHYDTWLLKDGITAVMFYPHYEVVADGEGSALMRFLLSTKKKFLGALAGAIPEPHVSLLGGLVVGAKEAMGEDMLDAFRATGLIHIVVLSGYNVTIIAEYLMRALSFLPRLLGIGVGASAIVLFALVTGASATVLRASAMALLVLLARAIGRRYDIMRALLLAGFVMVLWNPLILAFDPSFQLSFIATFGLISVAPIVEQFLLRVPTLFGVREALVATLTTQLMVLPYLLWMIGAFSLVAPLVNVLVLMSVPFAMLFGFITGVLGMVAPLFALPFGYISYAILAYEIGVVELFSMLPFAEVVVPPFPFVLVLLSYAALWGVLYRLSMQTSRQ